MMVDIRTEDGAKRGLRVGERAVPVRAGLPCEAQRKVQGSPCPVAGGLTVIFRRRNHGPGVFVLDLAHPEHAGPASPTGLLLSGRSLRACQSSDTKGRRCGEEKAFSVVRECPGPGDRGVIRNVELGEPRAGECRGTPFLTEVPSPIAGRGEADLPSK